LSTVAIFPITNKYLRTLSPIPTASDRYAECYPLETYSPFEIVEEIISSRA
jgi:hypothetical protein